MKVELYHEFAKYLRNKISASTTKLKKISYHIYPRKSSLTDCANQYQVFFEQ